MEPAKTDMAIMQETAPLLHEAIEKGDFDTVQMFMEHGFHTNFRITATGITLYSLLMGVDPKALTAIEGN